MKEFLNTFKKLPHVKSVTAPLTELDTSTQLVTGLDQSARALMVAAAAEELTRPTLLVTQDVQTAEAYFTDLKTLLPHVPLHLFKAEDILYAQLASASPEALAARIDTLNFLVSGEPGLVIAPLTGVLKPLTPPDLYEEAGILLDMDSVVDLDNLTERLTTLGYTREQIVAAPGEFSVRGGIIDIYPTVFERPVRIELFGDEIDSMRIFDAETQRSVEEIERLTLSPAKDLVVTADGTAHAEQQLTSALAEDLSSEAVDELVAVREKIETGTLGSEASALVHLFYESPATLLDYFPKESTLLIDDPARLHEVSAKLQTEASEWRVDHYEQSEFLQQLPLIFDWKDLSGRLPEHRLYFSLFQRGLGGLKFTDIHSFHYRQMQRFFGQPELIKEALDHFQKTSYTTLIMTDSKQRATDVQRMLAEFGFEGVPIVREEIRRGELQIVPFSLQVGFEWLDERWAVLTERELFNKPRKRPASSLKLDHAERLKDYNELTPGDYVVHVNHGIGKFLGIETMTIRGVHQDYLALLYQKHDKLYVPVSQLDLVQKYVSSEGTTPRVHKLGGTSWAKTKARVSKQVEDIADELIELYAERQRKKGYAFSPLDTYYREFENSFPYTETPDQLRSIQEVNSDLEKSQPMDRLVVGDVGYGKTEVAMRAAFRTVQEGKQVAFLVPTTVLAQQHYESFLERFIDFPIKIGVLSRFLTTKEVNETLTQVRKGQIDIVIGTHRLLSEDVKFQDLGLLVVDEEQRFGVKHKERLKRIKNQVDVLTLTATPIPRTLHMSIVGARDLSVIETAPANRYPVQTYVLEMNPVVIQEAIRKELARNGQVFFLHNRVQSIEKRVQDLQELVPEARIAYAHGQLPEGRLEQILYDFVNGEYDVLVTTTIIETGVDIPNVNTLIVEDADRMGLSQLYQLRGRVGRSSRVAYAYLMYRPDKLLTEESEKRLKAIQDFTELGSGFKIAMRDLSIRGAGNLLGQQQHGFIDSVGFDLYSQMLAEAVAKKQGKQHLETTNVELDLGLNAYLPESYIADERQKIEIYKRVRELDGAEGYQELQDELIDRFGDYPGEVAELLLVGLLKYYSDHALVDEITRRGAKIYVRMSETMSADLPMPEVFRALKDVPLQADFRPGEQLEIILTVPKKMATDGWLNGLIELTKQLHSYRLQQVIKQKKAKNETETEADDDEQTTD